jgi:hypothetical protein
MAGLASVGPLSCVALSMRGRARRSVRTRTGCGVLTAPASERNSIWSVIVPADGTRAAIAGTQRLRYVCFFGQLSNKPVLARIRSHGVRGAKRNGWSKITR